MSTASSVMNGDHSVLRSVVIWGYTNHQWLWVPLARELKRRHGAAMHFVVTNDASVAFWRQHDQCAVIDSYTTTSHFFREYDEVPIDVEAIYREARIHEDRYGVYVVDTLQADRHLGRGFAAAGPGHPRSALSDKATYVKSMHLFNRVVRFWEEYFDRVQPSLVIGNASSVVGKLCSVIARHRGISMRVPFLLSYGAFHGWGVDEYFSVPAIAERYRMLTDADVAANVTEAELAGMRRLPFTNEYYCAFREQTSLPALVRKSWAQVARAVRRRVCGVVTMGGYHLTAQLRALARVRADFRRLMGLPRVDVADLAGMAYVFFPLHVEPESSVGLMSPEMNEQLACIEFLAKNLPAGVWLIVKEHLAAIGRRPRDFYTTLLDIPNVIMVSPFAYALDAARSARAVAVITGTLGLESAVLGVPVISFGLHNLYGFLPHVHTVESWTALRPLLAHLCADDGPAARSIRQRDGRRFLAALKMVSVDLSWSKYAAKQRPPATEREVAVLTDLLLESLGIVETLLVPDGTNTPVARVPA